MVRSLTVDKTTRCVHCGRLFVPGKESNTPSGKFCSASCYRQWVRVKVRYALGEEARTGLLCGKSNATYEPIDFSP
jgi:hypothetical protein